MFLTRSSCLAVFRRLASTRTTRDHLRALFFCGRFSSITTEHGICATRTVRVESQLKSCDSESCEHAERPSAKKIKFKIRGQGVQSEMSQIQRPAAVTWKLCLDGCCLATTEAAESSTNRQPSQKHTIDVFAKVAYERMERNHCWNAWTGERLSCIPTYFTNARENHCD